MNFEPTKVQTLTVGLDGKPTKRSTLADVAKAAGVSVQTASHVLANNLTVRLPQKTRDRVMEAAREVGYQPNRLAQAMKTGRTNIISVWLPIDRPIHTYSRLLAQISRKARSSGKDLMIMGLDSATAYNADGKLPTQYPVDGMVAVDVGRAITAFRRDPLNAAVPLVVIGTENFEESDTVSWDLFTAYKDATAQCIARATGAVVHATPDWILRDYPKEQRRSSYSEAMMEAGLEPVLLSIEKESSRSAEAAIRCYMREHGVPSAVLCFTDTIAIGITRGLLEHGVRVPEQCEVIGLGDFPEAEDFKVAISTLRIPVDEIVSTAWEWLESRIQQPRLPSRYAKLPMPLILRESTKNS